MRCGGCGRELEVGDRYIKDKASGFMKREAGETDPEIDALVGEILSGTTSGEVIFCEDCTEDGGDYLFDTVYGDEDAC